MALSVLFESGIQHFADRPEGYYSLPDAAKTYLKEVPNAWDDTKLLDGYPGRDIILARRKGEAWYIGGINADGRREKTKTIRFDFLLAGVKYKLVLITDGEQDKALTTDYMVVGEYFDYKRVLHGVPDNEELFRWRADFLLYAKAMALNRQLLVFNFPSMHQVWIVWH